jgi:hypothetical protein
MAISPRRTTVALFACILLLLAACQASEQRRERIYRFVDEISFGGPMDPEVRRETGLVRWREPLKVVFLEGETSERIVLVEEHLAVFTRLTGVPVSYIDGEEDANVTVAFKADPDFLANREYVPCYVGLRSSSTDLRKATIEISVADPERIQRCVAHELMHTFGFRYHSGIVRSILSPAHDQETFSEWDELALEILYHPSVEAGLTREQAAPVFRRLIAELLEAS